MIYSETVSQLLCAGTEKNEKLDKSALGHGLRPETFSVANRSVGDSSA